MDTSFAWLVSVAVANGLWIIVFKSPLVKHLMSHFLKEEFYTEKDVENYLISNGYWFAHNLWICATCQSVWSAGAATLLFGALTTSLLILPVVFLATLPFTKWTQKHL